MANLSTVASLQESVTWVYSRFHRWYNSAWEDDDITSAKCTTNSCNLRRHAGTSTSPYLPLSESLSPCSGIFPHEDIIDICICIPLPHEDIKHWYMYMYGNPLGPNHVIVSKHKLFYRYWREGVPFILYIYIVYGVPSCPNLFGKQVPKPCTTFKTYSLKNLCQNATVNTNKNGKMVDFFLRGLPYIYIVIVNIHIIKL